MTALRSVLTACARSWVGPGILNDPGGKPKGMHWRTYYGVLARHDAFVGQSLAGIARKLGLLRAQLGGISIDAISDR